MKRKITSKQETSLQFTFTSKIKIKIPARLISPPISLFPSILDRATSWSNNKKKKERNKERKKEEKTRCIRACTREIRAGVGRERERERVIGGVGRRREGQVQIFAGSSSVGQLACGNPLRPQLCVGRASPATVLTPSPDHHRHRPQNTRSMVPHAVPLPPIVPVL